MSKNVRSFTIMEIIIVVIVVGLITAFALPNYGKFVARTDERIIIANMLTIKSAVKFYLTNTGDEKIQDWVNLDAINAALGISIIDTKSTYRCWSGGGGPTANRCRALHPSGWEIHFHNVYEILHCNTGAGNPCPSCEQIPPGTLGCGV